MDRSHFSIAPMQLQARFGDRVVPVFCARPNNVWAMISDAASRHPDHEALVCGDTRMNWREVVQRSEAIAAGFHRLGLRSGDRVAVLLGNRIEFVLTLFAAAHAGRVLELAGGVLEAEAEQVATLGRDVLAQVPVVEVAKVGRLHH